VAYHGEALVATALCGHDGRRGYLYHLAVLPEYRLRGIARAVCERCLSALRAAGITKCHLFVFTTNHRAQAFWQSLNWTRREDLVVYSNVLGDN
jgi:N-acetylglutamate synthase